MVTWRLIPGKCVDGADIVVLGVFGLEWGARDGIYGDGTEKRREPGNGMNEIYSCLTNAYLLADCAKTEVMGATAGSSRSMIRRI